MVKNNNKNNNKRRKSQNKRQRQRSQKGGRVTMPLNITVKIQEDTEAGAQNFK